MPTYFYKARDSAGELVTGSVDADGKEQLIEKLRQMGYITTQIKVVSPGIKQETIFDGFQRVSSEDMIIFYLQLSNMINAGIPLLMSLGTVAGQIENRKLKKVIGMVSREVEAGESFSQTLTKHPRIFPKLFVNMIKAAEASGKLDEVLSRYVEFAEAQADLRRQIKGALFYPAILFFAALTVILFIVTYIIPQFAEIFMKTGITLPMPTIILYKIGIGIKKYWYIIIFSGMIFTGAVRFYINTGAGRLNFDKFKLKLFILGSVFRKAAIIRFARTFATLIASGVPILQALDIVKEVAGNEVISRAITAAAGVVERGEPLAQQLKATGQFPPDIIQMIAVGEETGNLDGMLEKSAAFYESSLGYTIKKLTTVLEPIFLVIMGAIVGFIMASMLLPIFDMIKILGR
ncbi:MAG: type II secretion system F family protein [Candidatus Omnitrophota bacterium]|nr:MAG: type II secretion system F family protein [Candidatus Omnitrophota bacterium]